MIQEANKMFEEVKYTDILHSSSLFVANVILFFVSFPKLILEVTKHIDFVKRMILDA